MSSEEALEQYKKSMATTMQLVEKILEPPTLSFEDWDAGLKEKHH